MESERSSEFFRIASNTWQEFMDSDQFHSAIACGFSAYLILREKDDERLAEGALGLVRVAYAGSPLSVDVQQTAPTPPPSASIAPADSAQRLADLQAATVRQHHG